MFFGLFVVVVVVFGGRELSSPCPLNIHILPKESFMHIVNYHSFIHSVICVPFRRDRPKPRACNRQSGILCTTVNAWKTRTVPHGSASPPHAHGAWRKGGSPTEAQRPGTPVLMTRGKLDHPSPPRLPDAGVVRPAHQTNQQTI